MDHAVNVWMRLEDLVKVFLFPDVSLKEVGSLSANEFYAIEGFF